MKIIETSRPRTSKQGQNENSAFRFLICCVILTAIIFGLIHAVVHFTGPQGRVARDAARSAMTPTSARPPSRLLWL